MILKSWGRRTRPKEEAHGQEEAQAPPTFRLRPAPPAESDGLDPYFQWLAGELGEVVVPGFRRGEEPLRVPLDSLYVAPTLTVTRVGLPAGETEPGEGEAGETDVDEGPERDRHVGLGEVLSRHRHLVVVGTPEFGKTALLRYLGLSIGRRLGRQRLGLEDGLLPVLVSQGSLAAAMDADLTARTLCRATGWEEGEEGLEPLVRRALGQGRLVLLVDPPERDQDPGDPVRPLAWSARWVAAFPGIRCVVTADARTYEIAYSPSGFSEAWLDPSGPAMVEGISRRWFAEVERALKPDGDTERISARRAAGFLDAIRRNPRAGRLSAIPGYVTRMALAHLHRSDLPGSELDLAREGMDILLADPAGGADLTPAERLFPAQRAAFAEVCGARGGAEFRRGAEEALGERDGGGSTGFARWAADMRIAGLIREEAGEDWRFRDPLCRDYLAAREACRIAKDAESLVAILRERGCPNLIYWCASLYPDMTAILRATRSEHETLFRQSLQTAARCLTHGGGTGESIRREICRALLALCGSDQYRLLRNWALDRLSEIGAEEAVPDFIEQLRLEDPRERDRACEALGRIGGADAVGALSERAAHDPVQTVRAAACRALGRIGSEVAADPLARLALESEDVQVRAAACRALGRIGSERVLARMLEGLRDRRASIRSGAAFALGQIGDPRAADPLLAALEDEYSSVRWRAIQALGLMRAESALEALRESLSDEDWAVRREACVALGRIGSGSAIKPLVEALKDGYSSVRRAACEALGRIGAESAVAALIRSLRDEDWAVRREACTALTRIRSDAAVDPLLRALRDRDAFVRAAGAEILGRIDRGRAGDLLVHVLRTDEYSSVRRAACEALSRMEGDRYTEAIRHALKDSTSSVRRTALRGICQRRARDLREVLSEAIRDSDEEVREEACESLADLDDPAARDLLIGALTDASARVRGRACESLGRCGDAGCLKALSGLLGSPEVPVRDAAFEALWRVCQRTGNTVYLKDLE